MYKINDKEILATMDAEIRKMSDQRRDILINHLRAIDEHVSKFIPVSHEREDRTKRQRNAASHTLKRAQCQYCGKRVKVNGLRMHIRDVHGK